MTYRVTAQSPGRILLLDGWIDLKNREVRRTDRVERLTPTEARLVERLAKQPGVLVDTGTLLVEVWGYRQGVRSRTVYVTVQRLRQKLEVDPGNPHHLQAVFGSGYRWRPAPVEPAARRPRQCDEFVGRSALMARLVASQAPVLTIHGPGGVGKTRLVLECLARQTGLDAVFVPLDGTTDPCVAVSAVLGVDDPADLGRALARRAPALMVLDGVESQRNVVRRCVDVWREASPGTRWWITSRRWSRIRGEVLLQVPPLPAHEAMELWCSRVRAHRAGVDGTEPGTTSLIRSLDCLPLAIELAAARSAVMSAQQMIERMQRRFELLRDQDRSMQAVVAVSWNLLDPALQRSLVSLAALDESFDLDLAERVLGEQDGWAPDLVEGLCEHACLEVDHRATGVHFSLSNTLRAYTSGRLPEVAHAARRRLEHSGADSVVVLRANTG